MKRLVITLPGIEGIKARLYEKLSACCSGITCEVIDEGDKLTLVVPERHEDRVKSLLCEDMLGCLRTPQVCKQVT